ncbi:ABC transporter substrate-binding protein [Halomontanus rarus]|uniref:ABC transporter substrate-binding protein n=1 Tax=Halomontanus rarus TaxID=3034020 RepID=UPI0023E8525F|nr:ABC transporter substrate-binding protein [Halovivax sp. TS33]
MACTRRTYLAVSSGALAGLTAGCFTNTNANAGPGTSQSLDPDVDGAELLLNWQPNGLHVPYYAALERGFYEDQGLELAGIESGEGSDFSATQAGLNNAEFAVTSSDQVLNVNSEGLSPVCIGVIMQRSPVVVFTDRERFGDELTDPEQLAGETIGSGPGMVRLMTEAYLEYHDLSDDVEIADAGHDTVQQLLTGEIDVAAGVFGDVVDASRQNATIDDLSVGEDVPAYGHVIATSQSFLDSNPDAARAFLRGTARGAAWASNDVDGAIDVLVEATPELEEARENQRDTWDILRTEYLVSDAVEENGWGWNDGDVWEETADVLEEYGFLENEVDPDEVWTNEYLDTDYEYIGDFTDVTDE